MIAAKVLQIRESLAPNVTTQGIIQTASLTASFAPVYPNWTFSRTLNCSSGGPLRICSICAFLDCDVNPAFPESWWDQTPRFTAFSFILNNVRTLMATVPGEAIVELGWWIRNDSLKIGFDKTFILGYSNNYLGYITTPREYMVGGYEAMLTLFGIDTAEKIRNAVYFVASKVF